jgi:hypothetical protein
MRRQGSANADNDKSDKFYNFDFHIFVVCNVA